MRISVVGDVTAGERDIMAAPTQNVCFSGHMRTAAESTLSWKESKEQ